MSTQRELNSQGSQSDAKVSPRASQRGPTKVRESKRKQAKDQVKVKIEGSPSKASPVKLTYDVRQEQKSKSNASTPLNRDLFSKTSKTGSLSVGAKSKSWISVFPSSRPSASSLPETPQRNRTRGSINTANAALSQSINESKETTRQDGFDFSIESSKGDTVAGSSTRPDKLTQDNLSKLNSTPSSEENEPEIKVESSASDNDDLLSDVSYATAWDEMDDLEPSTQPENQVRAEIGSKEGSVNDLGEAMRVDPALPVEASTIPDSDYSQEAYDQSYISDKEPAPSGRLQNSKSVLEDPQTKEVTRVFVAFQTRNRSHWADMVRRISDKELLAKPDESSLNLADRDFARKLSVLPQLNNYL